MEGELNSLTEPVTAERTSTEGVEWVEKRRKDVMSASQQRKFRTRQEPMIVSS